MTPPSYVKLPRRRQMLLRYEMPMHTHLHAPRLAPSRAVVQHSPLTARSTPTGAPHCISQQAGKCTWKPPCLPLLQSDAHMTSPPRPAAA